MVKQEPIVIDSDDDEVAYTAGPSSARTDGGGDYKGKGRASEVKIETNGSGGLDLQARDAIKVALSKLDAEIKDVVAQLKPLQDLHASLQADRRALESRLANSSRPAKLSGLAQSSKTSLIDYQSPIFPWSSAILSTLKSTFHLPSFRLCQEGVINAAMDDRDIVCVMPTGGGKSLTYQLPAVIGGKGVTVVISPLLALIWDQVRALKDYGVECVMMTGNTSKEEQNEIYKRLEDGARNGKKEIRLCYVTPEKIAKSKRLMSVLEKVNTAGRLTRFVIDEAHCCSQLGHDFRPDYKKLSVLKTLFPRVPIQAVTATLSTKTLPDLLKILRLAPICDGRAANTTGTVFFSAPLYRPNLRYRVMTKPSSAKAAIEKIGGWIKENHSGHSGIVYCLSKKDAETVADALRDWSNGEIKTGVYHAGIDDYDKERIHVKWREGKVNCICATIAFGLGIDKGDVRYVIHHSMSKSLDGYYQETGRAGRDGKDSDCILFYRGQDAARLASLIYGDVDGTAKLQEMVRFAQDLKTCRKVAFAKYFSTSANLSANAWDHADSLDTRKSSEITTCGICDNCLRDPGSIVTRNVTIEAWRILKVLEEVQREGGRVTLAALADLVRGLGGGSFGVVQQGKGRKRKLGEEKGRVDVADVAGGKVELNKDDTEALLIHLTLSGYLEESYHATAYAVNVYLVPSTRSVRLSRLSLDQIKSTGIAGGSSVKIECTFQNPRAPKGSGSKVTRKKGTKRLVKLDEGDGEDGVDGIDGIDESDGSGNRDEASRRGGGGRSTVGSKGTKTTSKGTSKSTSTSTSKRNGDEKTGDVGFPPQTFSDAADQSWEDDEEALRDGYGDADEDEDGDWIGGQQVGTWKVHGASGGAVNVGTRGNVAEGLGVSRTNPTKTGEGLVGASGRQRGKGTSPVIVSD